MSNRISEIASVLLPPPQIHETLRASFRNGIPRPLQWRKHQILQLARMFQDHEPFAEALAKDIGKSEIQAYGSEIGSSAPSSYLRKYLNGVPLKVLLPEYLEKDLASVPRRKILQTAPTGDPSMSECGITGDLRASATDHVLSPSRFHNEHAALLACTPPPAPFFGSNLSLTANVAARNHHAPSIADTSTASLSLEIVIFWAQLTPKLSSVPFSWAEKRTTCFLKQLGAHQRLVIDERRERSTLIHPDVTNGARRRTASPTERVEMRTVERRDTREERPRMMGSALECVVVVGVEDATEEDLGALHFWRPRGRA
ncbi:hypothetical protein FB451DRAFT_1360695 [Mycena latifolia]|nr:hypothetical protein FB451DRAFT_1360695 [Mycena latifolia]